MRHAPRHATGPGSPSTATIVAILAVGIVYLIAALGVHLAASVDHVRAVSWWPLTAIIQLAKGQRRLPPAAEWIVPAMLVPATLLLVLVGRVWVARRPAVSDVDRAARLMGYGRQAGAVDREGGGPDSRRVSGCARPGIPVARSVAGGQLLYATWEEMQLCVAGPAANEDDRGRDPGGALRAGRVPGDVQQARCVHAHALLARAEGHDLEPRSGRYHRRWDRGVVVEPAELPVAGLTAA